MADTGDEGQQEVRSSSKVFVISKYRGFILAFISASAPGQIASSPAGAP